jgi:hypothetical protein
MGGGVQTLAYGSWPSPLDASLAAAHDGHAEFVGFVGFVGEEAWWTEARPTEGGRRTLVRRRSDGTEEPVLPAPWNVRSRAIEYGGQPWAGAVKDGGAPFLLLQGVDDVICPPAQCDRLLAGMEGRRVPHAYIAFEGEGYGFRRVDTMGRVLESEFSL